MGADKLNGKGAGRTIARDIELTPWSRALGLLDEVCEFYLRMKPGDLELHQENHEGIHFECQAY